MISYKCIHNTQPSSISSNIVPTPTKSLLQRWNTVNPLLSSLGAYLFQAHLRGGINRDGGGGRDLFHLEKTMVSVLHKELEYKVEKLKNKKVGGHAAEVQNQIQTSTWQINHPGSVHMKF